MAAGSFEAGRVHIRVLPDAENFNQKLRPVLEKAKKQAERIMHIRVTPELDRSAFERLKQQLRELDTRIKVRADVDTDSLRTRLEEATKGNRAVKIKADVDTAHVRTKLAEATRGGRAAKIKADVDTSRVKKQVEESVERVHPQVKPKLTFKQQLDRMKEAFKYHFEIPNVTVNTAKTLHELHEDIVNSLPKSELKLPVKLDDNVFKREHKRLIDELKKTPDTPGVELKAGISRDTFRQATEGFREFNADVERNAERSERRVRKMSERIRDLADKMVDGFHHAVDGQFDIDGDDVTNEFFDHFETQLDRVREHPIKLSDLIVRGDSSPLREHEKSIDNIIDANRRLLGQNEQWRQSLQSTHRPLQQQERDIDKILGANRRMLGQNNQWRQSLQNIRRPLQQQERDINKVINANRRLLGQVENWKRVSQIPVSTSGLIPDAASTRRMSEVSRQVRKQSEAFNKARRELEHLSQIQGVFNNRAKDMLKVDFSRPFVGFQSNLKTMDRWNEDLRRANHLLDEQVKRYRALGDANGVRRMQAEMRKVGKQLEENERLVKLFDRSMSDVFSRKRKLHLFDDFKSEAKDSIEQLRKNVALAERLQESFANKHGRAVDAGDTKEIERWADAFERAGLKVHLLREDLNDLERAREKFTNRAAVERFKDSFNVDHLKNDSFFRDRHTLHVDVDLDTARAEHKLDELDDERDVTINADADTGRARMKLATLTRPRHVLISPKIDKASAAKVLTVLAAISGARATWDFTKKFKDFTKDLDKNLTKIIKLGSVISTVSASVLSLTSHIFALGASLVSIAPSAFALPGILTGIGVAAFASVNALKQWNDRMKDVNDRLTELNNRGADKFWEQFEKPMRNFIDSVFPAWEKGMLEISEATGGFFGKAASAAQEFANQGGFASIFDSAAEGIRRMSDGMGPLTEGLLRFIDIGAKFFPRFGDWFTDMSNRFNEWTKNADISGAIDKGIFALKEFWRSGEAAVGILVNISKAAQEAGGASLTDFANALERMRDSLASVESQWTLTTLFRGANDALKELGPAFEQVGKTLHDTAETVAYVMGKISETIVSWVKLITEAFSTPAFQGGIRDAVDGISKGMAELSEHSGPLGEILGSLGSIIGNMAEHFLPVFGAALDALAPIFNGLKEALDAVVPILAEGLKNAIEWLGQNIGPLVEQFGNWAQQNPELATALTLVAGAVALIISALGPLSGLISGIGGAISGIGAIAGGVSGVIEAFGAGGTLEAVGAAIAAAAGPVALVIAGVLAIAGVIAYLYTTSEEFRNNVDQLGQSIMGFLQPIADTIQNDIAPAIGDAFKSIGEGISGLLNDLEPLFSSITQIFNGIITIATPVVSFIAETFGPRIGDAIRFLGTTIGIIFDGIGTALNVFGHLISAALKLITGDFDGAREEVQKIWDRISEFLSNTWDKIIEGIKGWLGGLLDNMGNFAPQLLGVSKETWESVKSVIKTKIDELFEFIKQFPQNVINFFSNIDLSRSGEALINGFKDGIQNAFNGVKGFVQDALSNIRGLFPFSPAKYGPFSGRGYTTYSGRALMRDFGNAILRESASVKDKTAMALGRVQGEFNSFSPKVPTTKLGFSAATSQTLDVNTQLSSGAAAKSMATALMTAMEDGVKLSLDPRSNEAILNFSDSGRRSLRR